MSQPVQPTPQPIKIIPPPLVININAVRSTNFNTYMQQLFSPDNLRKVDPQLRECYQVVQKLRKHEFGYLFSEPVNLYKTKGRKYMLDVERPTDLSTISCKIAFNFYRSPNNFNEDIMVMFNNALIFHKDDEEVFEQIRIIQKYYAQIFELVVAKCEKIIMPNEYGGQHRRVYRRKINRPPKKMKVKATRQETVQAVRDYFTPQKIKQFAKKLNSVDQASKRLIISRMNTKFGFNFTNSFVLTALNEEQLLYMLFLAQQYVEQNYGLSQKLMQQYDAGKRMRLTRYGYESQQSQFEDI